MFTNYFINMKIVSIDEFLLAAASHCSSFKIVLICSWAVKTHTNLIDISNNNKQTADLTYINLNFTCMTSCFCVLHLQRFSACLEKPGLP